MYVAQTNIRSLSLIVKSVFYAIRNFQQFVAPLILFIDQNNLIIMFLLLCDVL